MLNDYQQKLFEWWANDNVINGMCMVSDPKPIGDKYIAVIERFLFTVAISIVVDPVTRWTRFCYHSKPEALQALSQWEQNGFKGKPEGYIKQKPEGTLHP